ncbi:MAG: Spy/CpxP family protein refolding chaperone [Gammaproteobacteria bacterium]
MKRFTLALSAVLLMAQAALAQQPPPGAPPRGGPPVEQIARALNLDDAQKAEVKRVFDEQRAQHESERKTFEASGQRPTPEQMKSMMAQHEQELTQALSSVLSPEQLAKFKTIQQERRQHMRNGPPPPPPAQ